MVDVKGMPNCARRCAMAFCSRFESLSWRDDTNTMGQPYDPQTPQKKTCECIIQLQMHIIYIYTFRHIFIYIYTLIKLWVPFLLSVSIPELPDSQTSVPGALGGLQ